MSIFTEVKTYSCDLPLFKELGLKPFSFDIDKKPIDERTKYVGKVTLDESYVKVWVNAYPAQFWKFEIYNADKDITFVVSTGSGSLTNYWESIKLIATDMLVIETK